MLACEMNAFDLLILNARCEWQVRALRLADGPYEVHLAFIAIAELMRVQGTGLTLRPCYI